MPQSGNDHAGNRDLDVGAGLVQDEEIEPKTFDQLDARPHLLAPIVLCEFRKPSPPEGSLAVGLQIGMPAQWQRIVLLTAGLIGATVAYPIGGEIRIEFGH